VLKSGNLVNLRHHQELRITLIFYFHNKKVDRNLQLNSRKLFNYCFICRKFQTHSQRTTGYFNILNNNLQKCP
jgi:hypothetical protein